MEQRRLTLFSPAKINLYLKVTSKRDDGYHEIKTIFIPIDLKDTLTIDKSDRISVTCSDESVPTGAGNLAYKAAEMFFEEAGIKSGVNIHIEKNIPVAAGLGGGSGNAAVTLIGLDKLFGEPLKKDDLLKIASRIGADVPFFIDPRPVYAKGIGDKFVSYPKLPEMHLLLINPGFSVSTPWAYNSIGAIEPDIAPISEKLSSLKTIQDFAGELFNSLEAPVMKKHTEIKRIKDALISEGALGALMSGSGPTVFGIFETFDGAKKAEKRLKESIKGYRLIITKNTL